MSEINPPISFCQLLDHCPRIEVPLIQRDYAQGREVEKEVREHFLQALQDALLLPPDHPKLPLNLDFVYGSRSDGADGRFLPLDGQQRLTTLLLLHWYLAWRDDQLATFQQLMWDGEHSRFTYRVRPSSTEFFDELVRYVPHAGPDDIASLKVLIEDQPWFFLRWRLDPTIQSALGMLEAIHKRFMHSKELFARLTDHARPAITFQLLPLEHFGLSDDLYIKMNARGKPLTSFETFKARFEELLGELFPTETRMLDGHAMSVAAFFERRIDGRWTDFFWTCKDPKTHTFDHLIMNWFVALARISIDPTRGDLSDQLMALRTLPQTGASFRLFHEHGWLTREFADNLISVLEAWSHESSKLTPLLTNSRYFDERALFDKAIREPTALEYAQLIQFAAFVFYVRHHEGNVQPAALNEWMRVVCNLATNSLIERPDDYGRCLVGLRKLLPHSANILEHLSVAEIGLIGFGQYQVREEVLKAQLVRAHEGWRSRIDGAEEHGYFSGQIDFLLDFCGALSQVKTQPVMDWDEAVHLELQKNFDRYLDKTRVTFTSSGLAPIKAAGSTHLWKRALLTFGDYLVPIGSNYSFLTDPPRGPDSWKRFLRSDHSDKRQLLKGLWDRIDVDVEIEPQLQAIVDSASGLDDWRAAIVKHDAIMSYCGSQEVRWSRDSGTIYLLKKRQMNGAHAELFSYALFLEMELPPPGLFPSYEAVTMTEIEPHIRLSLLPTGRDVEFIVEFAAGAFRIHTDPATLKQLPRLETALRDQMNFAESVGQLARWVSRSDAHAVIQELVQKIVAHLP